MMKEHLYNIGDVIMVPSTGSIATKITKIHPIGSSVLYELTMVGPNSVFGLVNEHDIEPSKLDDNVYFRRYNGIVQWNKLKFDFKQVLRYEKLKQLTY
jgi:hypothetical protein